MRFIFVLATFSWLGSMNAQTTKASQHAMPIFSKGKAHFLAGQIDSAIYYFQQTEDLALGLKDQEQKALLLEEIALNYQEMSYFTKALDLLENALEVQQQLQNSHLTTASLEDIAKLYEQIEDYPTALDHLQKSLKIRKVEQDPKGLANTLEKIGKNLMAQENYDSAHIYLFHSWNILKELDAKDKFPGILYQIGCNQERRNQADSASFYLQEALGFARQSEDTFIQSVCLLELGIVQWKMGDNNAAINNLKAALAMTESTSLTQEKAQSLRWLSQVYKSNNNTQLALYYLEHYQELKDTLSAAEKAMEFRQIEADHQYEKLLKQQEHEEEKKALKLYGKLQQQQKIQFSISLTLFFVLLLMGVLYYYYQMKRRSNAMLAQLNNKILTQNTILQEQKEQLEELDQMKSQFFTNISHEFRSPVTVIDGIVHQLKNAPSEWSEKGLEMIRRNNSHLLNLVNQILKLRKLESGKLQLELIQDDVLVYLRTILEPFHLLAESRGIKLHLLCDERKLIMDFDQEKLLQILSNLVSNALKFTSEGGDVYVIVKHEKNLSQTIPSDHVLHIQVKDTGKGIAKEQLPYIFDRFYQVNNKHSQKQEGTGIGLALTHELVRLMEGKIDVKSELNQGTTIQIQLPVRNDAALIASDRQHAKDDGQLMADGIIFPVGKKEIQTTQYAAIDLPSLLIVEDNPDVMTFLVALLQEHYQLSLANDGQEGIDRAIELVPDLIISDVMMPKKDGFELCHTLKADDRTSHIPIILLTAMADEDARITGLKKGADAYLAKPVNKRELLVRLQNLLELRKQLQQRYQVTAPAMDQGTHQEDAFITRLNEIIEAHLGDETFSISQLCKAIGMSRSHLHLKLKALTDVSTSNYIRGFRLRKAKELLTTSGFNVTEVAFEVGFRDPAYFSRTFSDAYGVPPSAIVKGLDPPKH